MIKTALKIWLTFFIMFLGLAIYFDADAATFIQGPGLIEGVTATATAAGTTTLTKDSQTNQIFTGVTTQTVVLPDATTIPIGRRFYLANRSTGSITLRNATPSTIRTVIAGVQLRITLQAAGSAAGTWDLELLKIDLADTTNITGVLPLINGGTNKAMTASAGAVSFSDSDSLELTAVGSSLQVLQSAGTGTPAWSAATYPATTTVSQLLYSSSANVVAGLATANAASLITNGTGVPAWTASSADGQVLRRASSAIAFGAIDLADTDAVTGVLAIANGGTNKALTLSNGGMIWSDADSFEVLAAGVAGQILTSGGAATPAWITLVPLANGGTNKAMTAVNGGVVWTDADSQEVTAAGTSGQILKSNGAAAPSWSAVASTTAASWSGFHASDCSWARTNTAYGDPTADSACTLTESTNAGFGTVTSAVSGSDKLPGLVFTPPQTGKLMVCTPSYAAPNITAVAATIGIQLTDGTTVIAESVQTGLVSTSYQGFLTCSQYIIASLSPVTIKLQSKASAGTITIGGNGGHAVEWALFYIDEPLPTASVSVPLLNVRTETTTYTTVATDDAILCNGTFTINLVTASGNTGKVFQIKNIGTGVCTIDASSTQTIDGELTQVLSTQYSSITIISNGSNWLIL